MIVVICADHALAREVVAAAGAGEAVEAAHNWQHVSAHTRVRASVCVYGTARLDDRARAQLEEIRQSRPNMPLVLVTQHSRENSRALKDVSPSDVVWLDRVAEDLPSTLADLSRTVSVAGQLALLLESDGRMAGTKLLRTLLDTILGPVHEPHGEGSRRRFPDAVRSGSRVRPVETHGAHGDHP
jgi:hypothetical protein